jgi:peroxiredoxin
MKHLVLAVLVGVLLTSAAVGGTLKTLAPGVQAPAFTLPDMAGKAHALGDYDQQKAIVVMFISTQCPVSNAYNERMVQLHRDYTAKGITFLGINASQREDVAEIKSHAAQHGFPFPVLKDAENVIADAYGAQVTPQVYLIDPAGIVRYQGRIDDSRDPQVIKSQDLRAALDAVLTGDTVATPSTKAFGCAISRVKRSS